MENSNKERIIFLDRALNTRDLGGLVNRGYKKIKEGLLYRSSQLNYLSPADVEQLKRLNLGTVVDFRAIKEADELPDKLPNDVQVIHVPIIGNHLDENKIADYVLENNLPLSMTDKEATWKYGPFQRMLYLVNSYRDPAYVEVVKQYKPFFQQLLIQPVEKALLYHCTGGRDRTGLATAFLLDMLDVPMETIKANYLKSNELLQPDSKNKSSTAYQRFIFSNVYIQPTDNIHFIRIAEEFGTTPEKIYNSLKLKPEYLDQIFGNIVKEYGSMKSFYEKEFSIGETAIVQLKSKYLG
ncbi:hypothetical protein BAZ12_02215 [Elizabethkingia miricola]|uniref:tyrosine-protein phosphatase n=1 Tax=Bacteroidota TaxID=976 RepID=UPI0009C87ACC|nr:tyrosine-protein phosphatase [Elizabethkingia miricola]OPC72634.1 hypothetical protein BAZ12_02215 [Elizabethkingia miricola]